MSIDPVLTPMEALWKELPLRIEENKLNIKKECKNYVLHLIRSNS